MKKLYKLHGAGNDFIFMDAFKDSIVLSKNDIENYCNRHTGVGADGLVLICASDIADFRMRYYNSDGLEAEMCGNGARCAVAFSHFRNYCGRDVTFEAHDGLHHGQIISETHFEWQVRINLLLSAEPQQLQDQSWFVNTGVPHNVRVVNDVHSVDVSKLGAELRYNAAMFPEGANINFIALKNNILEIRTYERGVEDETLACGTGITASALVANRHYGYAWPITIQAKGGTLSVEEKDGMLWLEGPAKLVFTAELT